MPCIPPVYWCEISTLKSLASQDFLRSQLPQWDLFPYGLVFRAVHDGDLQRVRAVLEAEAAGEEIEVLSRTFGLPFLAAGTRSIDDEEPKPTAINCRAPGTEETLLHTAARRGQHAIADLLIHEFGADTSLLDATTATPLFLAASNGWVMTSKIIARG